MKRNKEVAQLIKTEKRLQKLETDNPRCGVCGHATPRNLEKHHVAGRKNSVLNVILCRNCHGEVSGRQEDLQPDFRSNDSSDPLLRQAAMLQGVALLLIVIAIALMAWSDWNIQASAAIVAAQGADWYSIIPEPAPQ